LRAFVGPGQMSNVASFSKAWSAVSLRAKSLGQ
jgi:hypothetical protein